MSEYASPAPFFVWSFAGVPVTTTRLRDGFFLHTYTPTYQTHDLGFTWGTITFHRPKRDLGKRRSRLRHRKARV